MIGHICNSEHSISRYWYVEMISWTLAPSSTTHWPDLAADVTCVTSRNLLLFSSNVTRRHDIVNPPRRVTLFMENPLKFAAK